jgi:hypothetical protein
MIKQSYNLKPDKEDHLHAYGIWGPWKNITLWWIYGLGEDFRALIFYFLYLYDNHSQKIISQNLIHTKHLNDY